MMYKISKDPLLNTISVSKIVDNTVVYFTEHSPMWAEYLAWVAEGNTAEEWSPDDAS